MNNTGIHTMHATAERLDKQQFERQLFNFSEYTAVKDVLDAINIFIFIINSHRQIIYSNSLVLKTLGLHSTSEIAGKRPGEAMGCIHKDDNPGGCGTAEACKYCNAVNLVLKSIKDENSSSGEIVVTLRNGHIEFPMNMFENVTPLKLCGEQFYLVSMVDISDTQRRRIFERMFFHDILNTSGALKGLVGLLKEEVSEEIRPDVEFVEYTFNHLVEEINEQRQLLNAENNELVPENITLQSEEIIDNLVKLYQKHELAEGKIIKKSSCNENITIVSDYVLLKRVLSNMIKNAIEATGTQDADLSAGSNIVEVGSNRLDEGYMEFWVWNSAHIPRYIQLQIFQRSFSTKNKNRGIGTYSMKLFGERYLNGKVGFETSEEEGTRFYLKLGI